MKHAPQAASTKATRIAAQRIAHHKALESLVPGAAGLALWRKLRRIENKAHAAATAQCNGAEYGGQPFREEGEWEDFCTRLTGEVAKACGGDPPAGFFFNTDPRGYALKIDKDKGGRIPAGLVTDWGGYGCLAAEINE